MSPFLYAMGLCALASLVPLVVWLHGRYFVARRGLYRAQRRCWYCNGTAHDPENPRMRCYMCHEGYIP